MTGTRWNTIEDNVQQNFFRGLAAEATHQITRFEYEIEADQIEIDKLIKLYRIDHLPKRHEFNSRGKVFWAKRTGTETPENHWEN